MLALAMVELHVELVAGAAAWLAAGWLLREQRAQRLIHGLWPPSYDRVSEALGEQLAGGHGG